MSVIEPQPCPAGGEFVEILGARTVDGSQETPPGEVVFQRVRIVDFGDDYTETTTLTVYDDGTIVMDFTESFNPDRVRRSIISSDSNGFRVDSRQIDGGVDSGLVGQLIVGTGGFDISSSMFGVGGSTTSISGQWSNDGAVNMSVGNGNLVMFAAGATKADGGGVAFSMPNEPVGTGAILLQAPNGSLKRLKVANDGTLSTEPA